jgi:hypothetical protein
MKLHIVYIDMFNKSIFVDSGYKTDLNENEIVFNATDIIPRGRGVSKDQSPSGIPGPGPDRVRVPGPKKMDPTGSNPHPHIRRTVSR